MSDWLEEHRSEIQNFGPILGPAPECIVVGCSRSPLALHLCKAHYKRARRAFDPSFSEYRGSKPKESSEEAG